jgi:nicotinamidase-related amidase
VKALINIDYTFDFIEGALPCGESGIKIESTISTITKQFIEEGHFTVFAIDLHTIKDQYHPETKLFPPHNIKGTKGRNLYGALKEVYEQNKELEHVYWMDKTRYSAFAGTDLEIKLNERNIKDVHLVGVCTDICVLHTAVDCYNKGFNLFIHEKATASFNDDGHIWALDHFKSTLGASIL